MKHLLFLLFSLSLIACQVSEKEENNLADKQTATVQAMLKSLYQWEAEMGKKENMITQ